ncbi:Proteasome-activating nucleotidase [uncultured archaeon]|nr:Proteasome-activating nucleotidase [uncultured archaeon]
MAEATQPKANRAMAGRPAVPQTGAQQFPDGEQATGLFTETERQSEAREKKGTYDVYDYVFSLEEQLKGLEAERQFTGAKLTAMQIEMERLHKEISEMQATPLLIGTIHEVLPDRKAIVKNSNGLEFLVSASRGTENELEPGKRVAMNQRNLLIMKVFPENKDWRVNAMEVIERPSTTFSQIGGLEKEINELNEAVILPLLSPESFEHLGIEPPNGVLLHGAPGTGKTMLAKAVANRAKATFISLSGTDLVRKYIGEGAKLVRDVFRLAQEKRPAIIFIDEIDSVGSQRFATANGDREVQRTMMQLLSEMDGFHELRDVKVIAATNRIDMLDTALLRPGRFDRVIEVPLPEKEGREKILGIHAAKMNIEENFAFAEVAGLCDGFSGADLKMVCTEAGMFALRGNRRKVSLSDFSEACRKISKKEASPEHRMFA